MTDIIDRANDTAQEDIERALTRVKRFDTPSLLKCIECEEDIPLQRQKLGGVTRCIKCQSEYEIRRKHYGNETL